VLAAALSTALSFGTLSVVSPPPAGAAPPVVPAQSSDALANAWGIKVITTGAAGNNPWNDEARVTDALKGLGIRHIRTLLSPSNKNQITYLQRLQSAGITTLGTMGRPDGQGGSVAQLVAHAAKMPGAIYALEGSNEWDLRGGSNWVTEVKNHQKAMFAQINANPALANKIILGPSVGHQENMVKLGDVSPWIDRGNLHSYPGGREPSSRLDLKIADSKANRGSKPLIATETGYHNYMQNTSTHLPASESVAGVYYPRLVLEYWKRGMSNVFSYQLLDNRPGMTGIVQDRESYFGLIRNDWSRKPAYTAMANFQSLINDPGGSFSPAPLSYSVTGGGSDLKQVLVAKRDGSHVLFLWRDVAIWDPKAERNLSVTNANLTLNLGKSASVSTIRPSTSRNPSSTVTGTSAKVSVGGEVVALTIR